MSKAYSLSSLTTISLRMTVLPLSHAYRSELHLIAVTLFPHLKTTPTSDRKYIILRLAHVSDHHREPSSHLSLFISILRQNKRLCGSPSLSLSLSLSRTRHLLGPEDLNEFN